MINIAELDDLRKIVVMNPKGGCGKTTLATNLASSFAQRGSPPTLVDCDPEGFCLRWLDKRPATRPTIHGIEGHADALDSGAPLGHRVHFESDTVIFDVPASIPGPQLHEYTYLADYLLIPIMPSAVDVYSATRFIAHLLIDQQLDRRQKKLGIVANRVRSNTRSYRMLRRFLSSLKIPVIAVLRDSQNFVYAADNGLGLCEMPAYRVGPDAEQLEAILAWLDEGRTPERKELDEEKRQVLIARAAYRRAEHRGFQGGDSMTDWLEAEQEVEAVYRDRVDA